MPNLSSQRDSELVERCLAGEEGAWRTLVERYKRLVYAIPLNRGMPEDACDDIFQSVFLILLRRLDGLRDHASLAKWLIVTTQHETARTAAGLRARPDVRGRAGVIEHAAAEAERAEERQRVWAALERLEPRCRELLVALYSGGGQRGYTRVADRLGIPLGSVGPSRSRCLARLFELLGEDRMAGS